MQFKISEDGNDLYVDLFSGRKIFLTTNRVKARVRSISLPMYKNGQVLMKLRARRKSRKGGLVSIRHLFGRACNRYIAYYRHDKNKIISPSDNSCLSQKGENAFKHFIATIYDLKQNGQLTKLILEGYEESRLLRKSKQQYMEEFFIREVADWGDAKTKTTFLADLNEKEYDQLKNEPPTYAKAVGTIDEIKKVVGEIDHLSRWSNQDPHSDKLREKQLTYMPLCNGLKDVLSKMKQELEYKKVEKQSNDQRQ